MNSEQNTVQKAEDFGNAKPQVNDAARTSEKDKADLLRKVDEINAGREKNIISYQQR